MIISRTKVLNTRILLLLPIPLAAHILFLISLLPPPSLSTIALTVRKLFDIFHFLTIHPNALPVPSKLSSQCLALSRLKFKAFSGCFLRQSPSLLTQVIR